MKPPAHTLTPDWPASAVVMPSSTFECDWRTRYKAVEAIVSSRNGCTITIEPIGKPELHEDGVNTWKRGRITVDPLAVESAGISYKEIVDTYNVLEGNQA